MSLLNYKKGKLNHIQALPKSKTSDISKQSPSPLHHTFLLGRARFTAKPLSALINTTRTAPIRSCVRGRTQFFKIVGFAGKRFLRSPPPPPSFIFFCSCPSFLDEPREETLATQASERELIYCFCRVCGTNGTWNPESGIRNSQPFSFCYLWKKSFRIYNIFLYLFFLNYRILSRKSQKSS